MALVMPQPNYRTKPKLSSRVKLSHHEEGRISEVASVLFARHAVSCTRVLNFSCYFKVSCLHKLETLLIQHGVCLSVLIGMCVFSRLS